MSDVLGNNNWIIRVVKCVLFIIAVIIVLRHIICFDLDVLNLVFFFIFVLFFIQMQGLAVVQLIKIKTSNIPNAVTTSFFMGLAVIFAEYFLSVLIHSNALFYIGCFLAIIYLGIAFIRGIKEKSIHTPNTRVQASFYCLIVLMLLLSMMDVQLIFIRPELADSSNLYQDYLYHMSLVNSISQGYPINNPDLFGETIHYHFFSDLLCAIPVRLFGLSSKFVIIDCVPYLNTYIVSISLFSFYRTTIKSHKIAGVYSLLTLCFFAGIPFISPPHLLCHIVTNINAIGLGFSAICCFLSNLFEWEKTCEEGHAFLARLLVLVVLIALIVGIKAPIGIVAIAALWGSVVLGFFFGRFNLKYITVLLSITAVGLVVYLLIVGLDSGGGAAIGFYFGEKAKSMILWEPIKSVLVTLHVPVVLRKVILGIVYFLLLFGVYCVLFIGAYLRELILVLRKVKPYRVATVLVYAMIAVAFLVYEIVIFPDFYSSEGYFMFVGAFFTPIITFWLIEDLKGKQNMSGNVVKVFFVICSCLAIVSMGLFIHTHLFNGIYNVKSENPYDIVTSSEYEGMCWIKDNTPEDSMLAVDRYQRVSPRDYDYSIMHHNTFFGYSAYSQRNCYLEGSGYTLRVSRAEEITKWISNNKRLYDPTDTERGTFAKKLGVDYVVVSKRLYPTKNLENDEYSLCFSNEDIDIYKIL